MVKQENPLINLYPQLKSILNFIVIKNSREADKHETPEMVRLASLYQMAILEQDTYLSYTEYFTEQWFIEVNPIVRREFIEYWIANPYNIPLLYREHLRERGRETVLGPWYSELRGRYIFTDGTYNYYDEMVKYYRENVERNNYYRMLTGMPVITDDEEDFIRVPDAIRGDRIPDLYLHELNQSDQDLIVRTHWFNGTGSDKAGLPMMLWLRHFPDKSIAELSESQRELINQDMWLDLVITEIPKYAYLRYLGKRRVDPIVARHARDFQLIRYIPMEHSGELNPHLLKDFADVYNKYRDYMVFTIYNREFEDLFPNYRSFMSLILTAYVLIQVCNRAVGHTSDFRFIDDKIIAIIFQMYGIPKNIIITMSTDVQRNFVVALMKLIRKKATNVVFYDIMKILKIEDVTLSKLLLMKQQYFDRDKLVKAVPNPDYGQAYFSDGKPIKSLSDLDQLLLRNDYGEPFAEIALESLISNRKGLDKDELDWEAELLPSGQLKHPLRGVPHFQAVDLLDKNPYHTIINELSSTFDYFDIIDRDPRWWDLPDTRDLVRNKNYTTADSKYIIVESLIRETDYLYEVIYFMRLILDGKRYTEQMLVSVPELFGTTQVPLFDLMIFLVAAMCYSNGLTGIIPTTATGLLAVAGFNLDLDMSKFMEFLESADYIDREKVAEFARNFNIDDFPSTIRYVYHEVMLPFRDWLTYMMSQGMERQAYLQYEKIFKSTFSYDIAKQVFTDDFQLPIKRIAASLGVSDSDITDLMIFYPHTYEDQLDPNTARAITIDELPTSIYGPTFLGNTPGLEKIISVPTNAADTSTGLPGRLYFYDVLHSKDLRYVKDVNGNDVPNPLFWDWDWQSGDINTGYYKDTNGNFILDAIGNRIPKFRQDVITNVIREIENLHDNHLGNAYFKVTTRIPDTDFEVRPGITYRPDGTVESITYLPIAIRVDGMFKNILISKIKMDMSGEAVPPLTYQEYLRRRNPLLYSILMKFNSDKPKDDPSQIEFNTAVMLIVQAIENALDIYLKVFEQGVAGSELYFKSLIVLIRYFKSYMVDFIRWSIKYIFDSKIDAGGGSNMLKLFDEIYRSIWNINIDDELGLYDTESKAFHKWLLHDKASIINRSEYPTEWIKNPNYFTINDFISDPTELSPEGGDSELSTNLTENEGKLQPIWKNEIVKRDTYHGSLRIVDEATFLVNGNDIDPSGHLSLWFSGEAEVGRFDMDDDRTDATYSGNQKIKYPLVDTEAWKEFVEEYPPKITKR